jgi:hypothetical protein
MMKWGGTQTAGIDNKWGGTQTVNFQGTDKYKKREGKHIYENVS